MMAVNPALIKAAAQLLTSEKGRKLIFIGIMIPIILLLLIITLFAYILSAPVDFLAGQFGLSGQDKVAVQNAQLKYKDYIKPENKVIDRGGFYSYPTDGTTGSRGFSGTPVPHPVLGISRPHWGQDFNSEWHSNIYSIADGQIYDMGFNEEAGMYIVIFHNVNGKKFFSRYLHLSAVHALPDSYVKQGDVIASEGGEPKKDNNKPYDYYPGTSTGHHLHFEVREGSSYSSATPVDPKLYIEPIPVQITCSSSGCYNSDSDGSITINLTGGREKGYNISLNGGYSWITTNNKSYTFSNLSSGTYRVIARDASYTQNASGILNVYISDKPKPTPTPKPTPKPNKGGVKK